MSKSTFKKEISGYSKEQLVEVLLEMYSARKEFKEYFEFFLDPDSEKLYNQAVEDIRKEFNRSKWGQSKMRVSKIKNIVKLFESFRPDPQWHRQLYNYIIVWGLVVEGSVDYTQTQMSFCTEWATQRLLQLYEAHDSLDKGVAEIERIRMMPNYGTTSYRNNLKAALNAYLEDHSA